LSGAPFDVGCDEILYQSARTRVFRRQLAAGMSIICKEPLGPNALERLRHEYKMLTRLAGIAGIPKVASGLSPANAIAFEDGHYVSLAESVKVKRLDVTALLALALQLARIVVAVHRTGVIHKDINPGNILLDGARAILIDYDLATSFSEERPSFLPAGEIAGSLAYLSPEQTGRTGRTVDQRADLYALGVTLYELAVGHPPFDEEDPLQLIHDHLARVPVPPLRLEAGIPAGLSEVIMRLLEKEPDQRYQSAEGLARDLWRLNDMQAKGERGTFPLGERDFPLRLQPPSRLVGRESEIAVLRTVFERALQGVGCVLVAGAPGVGKSALINELRPMVATRRGWFVSGKFDQYRPDAPSAPRQILCAIGRLLLAEPEAVLVEERARILAALGTNAALITALSPEFAVLLGVQPEVVSSDPTEAQHRAQRAWVDLLRAIASPARPLVLLLDDLQWAAASSIRAIDGVLTADNLHGVLLAGTYRDTEVDATHILSAMLPRWSQLDAAPQWMRLQNLPPADVASLLRDMLRLSPAEAARLADAVGVRTVGNPYDTIELVNALRRDGALVLGEEGWGWDASTIRRFIGEGEVVDLLTARIARLPPAAQSLLETMACIGGEVGFGVIQAATGLSATALEETIAPALEDGLLVMAHGEHINAARALCFRHDRVQQAVYARFDIQRRQAAHLAIARRLAVRPEFETLAADQYLPAIGLLAETDERRSVAMLLYEAAVKARQRVSFETAGRLLTAALALLNTAGVAADPLLAVIEIELHAALYCLGHLDEADVVYRSLVGRELAPVTLAEPGSIQINSLTNRGRLEDALALGLDLLRQLGLATPDANGGADILEQLGFLNRWVDANSWAADQQRPEISDPQVIAAARLINRLMPPASFCDFKTMLWLILESQRLWAEHGPCAPLVASLSCSCVATIALGQDFRCGYAIVRHVLAIGEARGYEPETSQARFLYTVSAGHWFELLEDDLLHAQKAHEGLVRGGDLQMACWNYYPSLAAALDCAPTLESYAAEINAALAFAERTGNDYATATFLSHRQLLRALRGETNAPGSFTDGSFDEEAHRAAVSANTLAGGYYHVNRALAAALFDDNDELAVHAAAAMSLVVYIGHMYGAALAHLLQALALAQRAHTAAAEQLPALLAEFDDHRDWLARRAADAPGNFRHLLKWLDAERAWVVDGFRDAACAFDAALREVDPQQRPWHRALISERAGRFNLAYGLEDCGRKLLAQASRFYEAWGASAKVRQLENRYTFLNNGSRPLCLEAGQSGKTAISAGSLDLLGILRASHVLSSETSMARLKARVGALLGEMTGATCVLLVLRQEEEEGGEWFLSAVADEDLIPLEEATARCLLPLTVFRYAERTREALLIEDAVRDERFARDPYLSGLEYCSMLAVPILNQGLLRAVLLLENRLSRGAFSAGRLDAIMLIAGQLAVSLDNALLYDSLERKVIERTNDLKLANLRLEALSMTDSLTGLANRRCFDDMIAAEWQRAIRPQTSIGVAMIDIDHFKRYNDRYGHLGGDECLRRVARVLRDSVRGGNDLVARYGGEEFIIVLPGADLAAVLPVAERARAAVEALKEPHEKSAYGVVTISVGIAAMVPTKQIDAGALVQRADAALYRAKKNGRNRIAGD